MDGWLAGWLDGMGWVCGHHGWCKHTRHSATTSFRRGLVLGLTLLMTKGNNCGIALNLGREILPPCPTLLLLPRHPSAQSPSSSVFITCAHEQLMLQCHTSAEGEPNQYCDYERVALIKTLKENPSQIHVICF